MGKTPDYYSIIQVDPRADREVIDAAYRRLAAKYHPDVDHSPGATERMAMLNTAYEVLSDPEKRRAYDLSRAASPTPPPGSSAGKGPRDGLNEWASTVGWSIGMLVISALLSRYGLRGLLLAGLILLATWLLVASRRS
jgi:DnaJ-class molecular chaperone